jgi:hypothetical protein
LGSRPTRGNLEQTRKLINLEKGLVMSRRAIISLAASVVVGIVSIATMSTDALAHRKGAGAHRVAAARPVAVVAGVAENFGPVADRMPRCIDSVIR